MAKKNSKLKSNGRDPKLDLIKSGQIELKHAIEFNPIWLIRKCQDVRLLN